MWQTGLMIILGVSLVACAPGLAPNGMTWEEYHAAEFRLKVVSVSADVAGCSELGAVRGVSDDDVAAAKEAAIDQAVLLRGNRLLLDHIWSDWRPFSLVGRAEIFYAEGTAYRCAD